MNIAVICEHSGIVRTAFEQKGCFAVSFDLLKTDIRGNHVIGDVRKLDIDWSSFDLAVCHPPCQYLSYAGVRHWDKDGRKELREEAYEFFKWCIQLPIDRICVENPKGYMNTVYHEKPNQIIQPWMFGHPVWKTTCLWTKNLFNLKPTNIVKPEPIYNGKNKAIHFTEAAHGWKDRSLTFKGIADAMAQQWTKQQIYQMTFTDIEKSNLIAETYGK